MDPGEGPSRRPTGSGSASAPPQPVVRAPKVRRKQPHILEQHAMFPRRLRRSPPSLRDLSESRVRSFLCQYLQSSRPFFGSTVRHLRHHIDRQLLPALQTRLVSGLVPSSSSSSSLDSWRFSCLEARDKEKLECVAHKECKIVYKYCDRIIRLLLSRSTEEFDLDLRRVRVEGYRRLAKELTRASISSGRPSSTPGLGALRRLRIEGGTAFSDRPFFRDVESMCRDLLESAPSLEELHLPICSNHALRSVSDMPKLKSFRADRTKCFNRRGLWHLCHPLSKSRYLLEDLHFGVAKHHHFNKLDVSKFFACMKALQSFSLMDEDRQLIKIGHQYDKNYCDKVMTYSALRLAIVDSEFTQASCPACNREQCRRTRRTARKRPASDPLSSGSEEFESRDDNAFQCNMTEIKVVDRQLKPEYLLRHCPRLTGLYLDWQEEMALPPFRRFEPEWFPAMLRGPDWDRLCSRLGTLEVVFPSAHTRNAYSLSLGDLGRLLGAATCLQKLKLVGAGRESPVPLIQVLRDCPRLKELHMEKTCIHVPDNYEVIETGAVNRNLKIFRFLGDMTSLLMNSFMTRGVAYYMPSLVELELQPESPVGYAGMSPRQMGELTRLQHLERLSLPLSVRECEMNMPEVIFVLRDMACLRFLVLSWGRWCNSYDISDGKVGHMMRWLYEALDAENANIHLQLSYNLHPSMFGRPKRRFRQQH